MYDLDKGNELVVCRQAAYYFRQASLPLACYLFKQDVLRMKPIVISLIRNFMLLSVCVVVLAACDDSAVVDIVTDSIALAGSKY
jgi:hypothetical protein